MYAASTSPRGASGLWLLSRSRCPVAHRIPEQNCIFKDGMIAPRRRAHRDPAAGFGWSFQSTMRASNGPATKGRLLIKNSFTLARTFLRARSFSQAPMARSSSPCKGCVVDNPPFSRRTCSRRLSVSTWSNFSRQASDTRKPCRNKPFGPKDLNRAYGNQQSNRSQDLGPGSSGPGFGRRTSDELGVCGFRSGTAMAEAGKRAVMDNRKHFHSAKWRPLPVAAHVRAWAGLCDGWEICKRICHALCIPLVIRAAFRPNHIETSHSLLSNQVTIPPRNI
jgi:hypothetical protein